MPPKTTINTNSNLSEPTIDVLDTMNVPVVQIAIRKPQLGDIVLYSPPQLVGRGMESYRPAIITQIWGGDSDTLVNLSYFPDGTNDPNGRAGIDITWRAGIEYSLELKPNTWKWKGE